jgi:hypothetical protein
VLLLLLLLLLRRLPRSRQQSRHSCTAHPTHNTTPTWYSALDSTASTATAMPSGLLATCESETVAMAMPNMRMTIAASFWRETVLPYATYSTATTTGVMRILAIW